MKQSFDNYGGLLRRDMQTGNYYSLRIHDNNTKNFTRDKLFWDFRYQSGSYKARKSGITPCSVMMKYKNDKFRLYGEPENNKLFDQCKAILKGWKARNKAEVKAFMPEYKQWLKENHLKGNHFSYWLINIKHLNN